MSTTSYVELNSAYRNRREFPLASEFIVRTRTYGSARTAITAADPISAAAPTSPTFTPFTPICGTVNAVSFQPAYANSTGGTTLNLSFPSGTASHLRQYYTGAMLVTGGTTPAARILHWTYINTAAGRDQFQAITDAAIAANTGVCIHDPTDLNDPTALVLFVPQSTGFIANQLVYNQTQNQALAINFYDAATHTVLLKNPSGSYNWLTTDKYAVRGAAPTQVGNSLTVTGANTATTALTTNSVVGSFIRLLTTEQIVQIVNWTAPNVVTVSPNFGVPPATTDTYELLPFTRDSENTINLSGCLEQGGCFNVCLISLSLPSATLTTGLRPVFYPYFYVELRRADGQSNNRIYSNNPNMWRAVFRTVVTEDPDTEMNPFVRSKCDYMCQTLQLDQGDFYFRVFLPDGTPFETVLEEAYSPAPPNPGAQISALFSFTKHAC